MPHDRAHRPSLAARCLRALAFAALALAVVVVAANVITVGATRGNVHTVAQTAELLEGQPADAVVDRKSVG